MEIRETSLPGVLLLVPKVFPDDRGYFFESYRSDLLGARGIPPFVQDNQSGSTAGTIRGLHYQLAKPQGKLIRVLRGSILDVAVDIRRGSPTFGRWTSETLTAENRWQLYIPPGFAHGFCAIGDAEVMYKVTDFYSGAADQLGVRWDDPGLAIPWPTKTPLVSPKDQVLAPLDLTRGDLPEFRP